MKLQVHDFKGNNIKEIIVNNKIWGIKPHKQAIFDAVIAQRSSLRQGTHKTKTRTEVSGGGRKPWRQKGTGRARQGSIRSPQWRGGGIVFGPNPKKNYLKHVNKKIRKLAIRSALSLKIQDKNLIIIDKFCIKQPSTKAMISILNNLNINNKKILIITIEGDEVNFKSSRNIKKVNIITYNRINVYDLLNIDKLLIIEQAIKKIEELYL